MGDIYSRENILQPLYHISLPQCGTFVPAELHLHTVTSRGSMVGSDRLNVPAIDNSSH